MRKEKEENKGEEMSEEELERVAEEVISSGKKLLLLPAKIIEKIKELLNRRKEKKE